MSINIRQEKQCDYAEVYTLVKKSFATTSFSDGTEADYLNEIRKRDTFFPDLSLVAENGNGKIVGQIVLYEMSVYGINGSVKELVLSPLCVDPEYFRRGIAGALIQTACGKALKKGFTAVFLCGDPAIYSRLGFRPTFQYSIYHINDKEHIAQWCMVKELKKDSLKSITGIIDIE